MEKRNKLALIWSSIILLGTIFVVAELVKPVWVSYSVNNTAPRLNQTLKFEANFTDNVGLSGYIFSHNLSNTWVNLSWIPFNTDGIMTFVNYTNTTAFNYTSNVTTYTTCYQETANQSNDCGNIANGTYAWSGCMSSGFPDPGYTIYDNWLDGNWSTYTRRAACAAYLYVNYSLPINETLYNVTWSVKEDGSVINVSIPDDCINNNLTQLRIYMYDASPPAITELYCFNETASSYVLLNTNTNDIIYEEAIYWNFTKNLTTYYNTAFYNLFDGDNNTYFTGNFTNISWSYDVSTLNYTLNNGSKFQLQSWVDCVNSGVPSMTTVNYSLDSCISTNNTQLDFNFFEAGNNPPSMGGNYFYNITCNGKNVVGNEIGTCFFPASFRNRFYEQTVFLNVSLALNSSTTSNTISMYPIKNISSVYWKIYVNDTSGNINETDTLYLNITKTEPNVTVLINNKPIQLNSDLNLTISFFDPDEDSWISNETKWYNGTVEITAFQNLTSVTKANFTNGQTWTASARVFDGFNWSIWKNDTVVINDTIAPVMSNITADTSLVVLNAGYLYVSCADSSSSIASVGFSLKDPTGTIYHLSSSTPYSGSTYRVGYSFNTIGTWNYTSVNCSDSSGNIAINSTVNLLISVTSGTVVTPTTGGGGGSPTGQCQQDSDCASYGIGYTCINSYCVKRERKDVAYSNLQAYNLPESVINQIITESNGVCNYDGVCEIDYGENIGNCKDIVYPYQGKNIIIKGDCKLLDMSLYTNFFVWLIIIIVVILIIASLQNRRRR